MKISPEKLEKVLQTLAHSWGSDTPQEAIWTFYELVNILPITITFSIKIDELEAFYEDHETVSKALLNYTDK